MLEGEKKLQAKVATRWNSELRSIKSILSIPEDKLLQLDTVRLTTYERNMLQDLVEILTPFQEATDFTQGENVVTASFVLPCIVGLRKSLESLSVKFNLRMILTLKQSLNKPMAKYEDGEIFLYASILDLRFKLKWCSHPDDIISKFTDFVIRVSETEVTDDTNDPTQPKPPKQRKKNPSKLLGYIFSETSESDTSVDSNTTETIRSKVTTYFSDQCLSQEANPLQFWKENTSMYPPAMSKLAKRYLSVPASLGQSNDCLASLERCRLTSLKILMFIKCNSYILDLH